MPEVDRRGFFKILRRADPSAGEERQPDADAAAMDPRVKDLADLTLRLLAAAAGEASALAEFDRSVSAGESPQAVIAALQRHFLRLHRMRGALDAGRSMDDIVRGQRPPLHFKQRDAIEQQCRSWPLARLGQALARIAEAAKAARLNSGLEGTLAERLVLDLQALAKAR